MIKSRFYHALKIIQTLLILMQLVCTAVIPEPFASLMFYTASNTTSEQ